MENPFFAIEQKDAKKNWGILGMQYVFRCCGTTVETVASIES